VNVSAAGHGGGEHVTQHHAVGGGVNSGAPTQGGSASSSQYANVDYNLGYSNRTTSDIKNAAQKFPSKVVTDSTAPSSEVGKRSASSNISTQSGVPNRQSATVVVADQSLHGCAAVSNQSIVPVARLAETMYATLDLDVADAATRSDALTRSRTAQLGRTEHMYAEIDFDKSARK